jgi:hypothetical protein
VDISFWGADNGLYFKLNGRYLRMSTSLKSQEEEMTQALYAHMNNKTIKIKKNK